METHATNVMKRLKGLNKMKMKKIAPLALSALLLGTVSVAAEQPDSKEVTQEVQHQSTFNQTTGKITSIASFGASMMYTIEDEENPFQFIVSDSTIVLDKKGKPVELKEGNTVTIYVYANQPMILIYPPRYNPAVVIVGEEEDPDFVKVGTFDKNFVSEDNQLKLNFSEHTLIVNANGLEVPKDEVTKQNAIVFYGPATFSIPAQTTPSKVVVFPKYEDQLVEEIPETEETETNAAAKIDAIIGKDFYEVKGKKMVPLRKVSEALGYKVESTAKGAILSKGVPSYTITRGEKAYGYNKSLRQFEVAPALLEYGKTYVEYNFALELLK